MGGKAPKIPPPVYVPPPPTPVSYNAPTSGGMKPGASGVLKPDMGGTFLTASMPNAQPLTRPKKAIGAY